MPSDTKQYTAHWTPLESNPQVFTDLARNAGLAQSLAFQDIYSLETDFLDFIRRPAFALVLAFPGGGAGSLATPEPPSQHATSDQIIWFKQTINNACGLYGLLHAVCNGEARSHIQPNSILSNILSSFPITAPENRYRLLQTPELDREYHKAARAGDTEAPEDPAAEVDSHYTCFVKDEGRLWELDGDMGGPIILGELGKGEDVLSETALGHVRRFMESKEAGNIGFNMLALLSEGNG